MADLHEQGASDARSITISTTVQHAGRVWTVAFTGYTLDQAADILERRGLAPVAGSTNGSTTEAAPLCPKHQRAMKPGRGGGWFCSAKDDDGHNGYCSHRVK
jgi:hypothetical protein